MDIVDRLGTFLKHYGISNSKFADTCDIPRPTLSQLLNGRNKKVSDEVITKINTAYPNINMMWLMFGDGDMVDPNVPNANMPESPDDGETTYQQRDPSNVQSPDLNSPISFQGAFGEPLQRTDAARRAPNSTPGNSKRFVTSVMVVYSDGSIETFGPMQK